jgi:hypothetical protein
MPGLGTATTIAVLASIACAILLVIIGGDDDPYA